MEVGLGCQFDDRNGEDFYDKMIHRFLRYSLARRGNMKWYREPSCRGEYWLNIPKHPVLWLKLKLKSEKFKCNFRLLDQENTEAKSLKSFVLCKVPKLSLFWRTVEIRKNVFFFIFLWFIWIEIGMHMSIVHVQCPHVVHVFLKTCTLVQHFL